eukprot:scaffold11391_cov18-Tisochrysis_lutea.AAC.5
MGNWTFPCMTYCSQLLGPWRGTWSHRWARDPDTPREQQGTCDPDTPREQQGTCGPDTRDRCSLRLAGPISKALA